MKAKNPEVKLSVPIKCELFSGYSESYLKLLKSAGAGRVFLHLPVGDQNFIEENWLSEMPVLHDSIALLESRGYEVGVWITDYGMGHEIPEAARKYADFTQITDIEGKVRGYAFCPLDNGFTGFMARRIESIARRRKNDYAG